ncbi:hypothetical protein T484DRAFT_1892212, partial [Baffinella frigidus]
MGAMEVEEEKQRLLEAGRKKLEKFRNKQSKTGKKSKKGAADAAPAPTSASTNGVPSESAPVKVGEHLKESAGAAASEGGDGGKVPNGHSSAMPAEEVVRGKPAEEEARTLPPAQKPAADVDVPVIVAKKTQAGVPTREAANADVRAVSPVPPAAPVAPAAVAPTPEHPEEHTPSTTNGVGAAAISKFLRERDERMRVVLSAALELEHAVASASLGAGGGRDADARADALLRTSHDLVQRLEASNVQPALRGAEGCFPAVEQALVLLRAAAAQREKANVPGAGRAPQGGGAGEWAEGGGEPGDATRGPDVSPAVGGAGATLEGGGEAAEQSEEEAERRLNAFSLDYSAFGGGGAAVGDLFASPFGSASVDVAPKVMDHLSASELRGMGGGASGSAFGGRGGGLAPANGLTPSARSGSARSGGA